MRLEAERLQLNEQRFELERLLTDERRRLESLRGQAERLTEQRQRQEREQSLDFQMRRLFEMNWRAVRSVEFEQYLRQVFLTLGYCVETTKVTVDQGVDLNVANGPLRIAIQVKGYHSRSAPRPRHTGLQDLAWTGH